jgi:hypothetical protein
MTMRSLGHGTKRREEGNTWDRWGNRSNIQMDLRELGRLCVWTESESPVAGSCESVIKYHVL